MLTFQKGLLQGKAPVCGHSPKINFGVDKGLSLVYPPWWLAGINTAVGGSEPM